MKLLSFLIVSLLLNTNFLFAQKIGLVENYNPIMKHAHLKSNVFDLEVKNIEDLDYNISPYIDSLFLENNINTTKFNDFGFSIFQKIFIKSQIYINLLSNKNTLSTLNQYSKSKNIDYLIIIDRHNIYSEHDPLGTTFSDNFDFGITTHNGRKKRIYFYNSIRLMYYDLKNDKLYHTFSGLGKNKGLTKGEWKSVKFDKETFDNSNSLVLLKENQALFLKDYKVHFKFEFDKMVEKLNKDIHSTK